MMDENKELCALTTTADFRIHFYSHIISAVILYDGWIRERERKE